MKSGLLNADFINTVSNTYANEIRTSSDLGAGLKDVLAKRKKDLFGIRNGIDTKVWNPEKDKLLPKKYTIKTLEAKQINKEALTERFGLEYREDVPIFGIISRLYDSKGIDFYSYDSGFVDEIQVYSPYITKSLSSTNLLIKSMIRKRKLWTDF